MAAMKQKISLFSLVLKVGLRAMLKQSFWQFWAQAKEFEASGGIISQLYPVIGEAAQEAGGASGHYFHQDLVVARQIYLKNPRRHIDVGSSIYGFVSHVASFREIEILDVRPLSQIPHPSIRFTQADLMHLPQGYESICDSVSCLHALEHFGLGRYGDPIDPQGYLKGFRNLVRMLQLGGAFYLGIPIGKPKVCFNAHRVFAPDEPLRWAQNGLKLEAFHYVDDMGNLHPSTSVNEASQLTYGCGIYIFKKTGVKE